MESNLSLALLILCVILSSSIGGLSEEHINSWKLHSRKKRLLDRMPGEKIPVKISDARYIVNIVANGESDCVGSILSPHLVITCAHCLGKPNVTYIIRSGSASIKDSGNTHTIQEELMYCESDRFTYDLTLAKVIPPIKVENSVSGVIKLHNGYLPAGTLGTIISWGCNRIIGNMVLRPSELESIEMPIIHLETCQETYRMCREVTRKEFCAQDVNGKKGCTYGDSGAPFIVNNELVGMLSWTQNHGLPNYPDVFINLSHSAYRDWITSKINEYL